ncbi:MAG: hypothetical protein ABIR94_02200 [Rubrivivax sp.]
MDDNDFGLAVPPFDVAGAMVLLKRHLRDLKLSERGARHELKGRAVVELAAAEDHIDVRLAKRASASPEWSRHQLRSSADVRGFVDQVKRTLARWSNDE